MEELVHQMLVKLGEDPKREGLQKTPQRVTESMKFLTSGYQSSLDTVINDAIFNEDVHDMIVVKDIEFYSLCEHHLLPFTGKIHIGYIPDGKVVGLSKFPRIVDHFSRRLQIQERLGRQIAEAINEKIKPKGVGVVIEASHFCMMMRGVQKQHSKTINSTMLGLFRSDSRTRSEFLDLIKT